MQVVYKATNEDMTCTSGHGIYQYHLNKWMKESKANVGQNGLHACLNVLDCLIYYPHIKRSRYFVALADGDISEDGTNTRISCTRMKLIKELSLDGMIAHAVKFIIDHQQLGTDSSYVVEDAGSVKNSFLIVKGKNPLCSGNLEDRLVFLTENDIGQIIAMNVLKVDGKNVKPERWYDSSGNEVNEP